MAIIGQSSVELTTTQQSLTPADLAPVWPSISATVGNGTIRGGQCTASATAGDAAFGPETALDTLQPVQPVIQTEPSLSCKLAGWADENRGLAYGVVVLVFIAASAMRSKK